MVLSFMQWTREYGVQASQELGKRDWAVLPLDVAGPTPLAGHGDGG